MQRLEILLEDNASGSVHPLEVAADAPVGALVPALVEELHLPQTDLFGKKLVYMLRQTAGGRIIPEHSTLNASGIRPGTCFALDSFVLDGSVATLEQQVPPQLYRPEQAEPNLYSSATIADMVPLVPVQPYRRENTSAAYLALGKKERKWTRRAFFIVAGTVLGAGSVGLGYAAYNKYILNAAQPGNPIVAHPTTAAQPTTAPVPTFPTTARTMLTFTRHQQTVRTVAWSAASKLLASSSDDGHVFVWGMDGAVQQDLQHPSSVHALAWSPEGQRLVTGMNNGQITFFNAQTGAQLARPNQHHAQMVNSLAWSGQSMQQVVSGSADNHAIVWDGTTYQLRLTYARHTLGVDVVAWAADGQTVASASQGGYVRVWNAANGQDVHGFYQDAQRPMRAMAFAPTGAQLAVGGDDGIVRVWNGLTCGNAGNQCRDMPQRFQVSQKAIRSLAWSPDARLLAAGSDDGMFSLWAPGQRQQALLTAAQNAIVHSIAWSPDGKLLATAAGNTVALWTLS